MIIAHERDPVEADRRVHGVADGLIGQVVTVDEALGGRNVVGPGLVLLELAEPLGEAISIGHIFEFDPSNFLEDTVVALGRHDHHVTHVVGVDYAPVD